MLLVGGSSQIGLAIISAATRWGGATVILAGRPSQDLDAAAFGLRSSGNTVSCLNYDARWSQERTADMMLRAAGEAQLDLVVVAVGRLGPTWTHGTVAEPELEDLVRTNLLGPALVANEAAGLLVAQKHGHLIVVTSAAAARPRGRILGYSIAKQALDSFVIGLDRRTRPHGVRCRVVRPGQVRTRMTEGLPPVPFTTGPEQVALRVRKTLNSRSAIVWSPRALRPITMLLRLTPNWALPEGLQ